MQVAKAMAESDNVSAAATLLQKFVEEYQIMIPEAVGEEGALVVLMLLRSLCRST